MMIDLNYTMAGSKGFISQNYVNKTLETQCAIIEEQSKA